MPKTTSPRRNGWLSRLGTLCCAALVCAVFGWLGFLARKPVLAALQMRQNNDRQERDLCELQLANQRMEREIARLTTRAGKEAAARRSGYILPHEYRLRIPDR
jgi:cell division protein FtsB